MAAKTDDMPIRKALFGNPHAYNLGSERVNWVGYDEKRYALLGSWFTSIFFRCRVLRQNFMRESSDTGNTRHGR